MININFNTDFYNAGAVKEAVKVYSQFADFKLKNDTKHVGVELTCKRKKKEDEVVSEFLNYVLMLRINNGGI